MATAKLDNYHYYDETKTAVVPSLESFADSAELRSLERALAIGTALHEFGHGEQHHEARFAVINDLYKQGEDNDGKRLPLTLGELNKMLKKTRKAIPQIEELFDLDASLRHVESMDQEQQLNAKERLQLENRLRGWKENQDAVLRDLITQTLEEAGEAETRKKEFIEQLRFETAEIDQAHPDGRLHVRFPINDAEKNQEDMIELALDVPQTRREQFFQHLHNIQAEMQRDREWLTSLDQDIARASKRQQGLTDELFRDVLDLPTRMLERDATRRALEQMRQIWRETGLDLFATPRKISRKETQQKPTELTCQDSVKEGMEQEASPTKTKSPVVDDLIEALTTYRADTKSMLRRYRGAIPHAKPPKPEKKSPSA